MRSGESIALVKPYLAGGSDPTNPLGRVVVEQHNPLARDTSCEFKRDFVNVNEVDTVGQVDLPSRWGIVRPPGCDVEIGGGTSVTTRPAPENQSELSAGGPQRSDNLCASRIWPTHRMEPMPATLASVAPHGERDNYSQSLLATSDQSDWKAAAAALFGA